jgi:hypothetical protein
MYTVDIDIAGMLTDSLFSDGARYGVARRSRPTLRSLSCARS